MEHSLDALKAALWDQFEAAAKDEAEIRQHMNQRREGSYGFSLDTSSAIAKTRGSLASIAGAIIATEKEQREGENPQSIVGRKTVANSV